MYMKQFILVFTAVMFLANTFAVSAWAKPCMGMNPVSSITKTVDADTPPCHEQQDRQKQAKHCDGLCLCIHAAINQTATLTENADFLPHLIKSDRDIVQQEDAALWATYPPRRPPKYNS